MAIKTSIAVLLVCLSGVGCKQLSGRGGQYRVQYEGLKKAVLEAPDAKAEAQALRDLGRWLSSSPYGYTLATASQPGVNGVDIDRLKAGDSVHFRLLSRSDYEPRTGGFDFVPKDKANLLLLEAKRSR